ncbi:MAG: hypothetical protein J6V93_01535 [Clostridia bacterium]|nr:hypothetical protein [Clostridia bacterium]
MKKIILLILTFALVINLCACFKDKTPAVSETYESDSEETLPENESVAETTPPLSEIPLELYSVEIKQETLDTGKYTASLIYPHISGYSDAETEEKVNAIIYSYVMRKMNTSVAETGAESGVEYFIDSFNVTYKGDKLISALCRGSVDAQDTAYSASFAYGINIDLSSAKLISFDSIVDYNGFKNDFVSGGYKIIYGYEKLLSETTAADLVAQYDPLYSIYPEFYIKEQSGDLSLGVIVDTVQIYGDVAALEGALEGKRYTTEYFTELTEEKVAKK